MTGSLDYRTLAEMVDEVSDIVGAASDTETRIIKDALNRRYAQAANTVEVPELMATDFTGLRKTDDTTLTSLIANDAYLPLPWNCARVKSLTFQTIDATIDIVEATELVSRTGSRLATTGLPCLAAVVGETAQYRALPQDESVSLTCDLVANDNSKTVRVQYIRSSTYPGLDPWQDVTGQFSNAVALNSTCESGYPILSVALPEGWVGGLTMAGTTSDTEIVSLRQVEEPVTAVNESTQVAKRLLLRVSPIPDINYALTVVYWKRPIRLTEDGDIPLMPISGWLTEQATADFLRAQGKFSSAGSHDSQANKLGAAIFSRDAQPGRTVITPYMGNFRRQTGMARRWGY